MPAEPFEVDESSRAAPRHDVKHLERSSLTETRQDAVRSGASLTEEHPPLPENRSYQDLGWLALFLVVSSLGCGCALYLCSHEDAIRSLQSKATKQSTTLNFAMPLGRLVLAVAGSAAWAVTVGLTHLVLYIKMPECMVWFSLIFPPIMITLVSFSCFVMGGNIGSFLLLLGCLPHLIILICFRKLIPFTASLLATIAGILKSHKSLIPVAFFGALLPVFVTSIFLTGAFLANIAAASYDNIKGELAFPEPVLRALPTFFVFLVFWFGQVGSGFLYLIYSGVFARWYFGSADRSLQPSISAAFKSLGSASLAGLLVAIVRTLEFLVKQAIQDSRDNIVMCIILTIAKLIISCIGDILEYLNKWALIQCALRNTDFMTSVRITLGMATQANLEYITSDTIISLVLACSHFLCGFAGLLGGLACGACAAWGLENDMTENVGVRFWLIVCGGIVGFCIGFLASLMVMEIFEAGVKTILMLWAEDTAPLERSHPEVHNEFVRRIYGNMEKAESLRGAGRSPAASPLAAVS